MATPNTPETKEIFQLYRMRAAVTWELEPLVADIEIERDEWKSIAMEALKEFKATNKPGREDHWSHRVDKLLKKK
jgi:hypothetical protein